MKFKHQAKRSALKKAVKDVQAQIKPVVDEATLGANAELKKEQDKNKCIKEKFNKQKADLEAQLEASIEKANQQEKEISDLKASNEQL